VGGERARNNLGGQLENPIGVEPGRVYRNGIGGCREGSDPTLAVACVAFLHVLQDTAVYNRRPALPQLPEAPFGSRFGAGYNKQLNRRIRTDRGTDVAAVEDGAAGGSRRMSREIALPFEQGGAHLRDRRDDRGGLRDRLGQQSGGIEGSHIDPPRGGRSSFPIGRIAAFGEHEMGGGAIELAGVEVGEAEALGEAARQGAFARSGRPVDRDNKGPCGPSIATGASSTS